MYATNKTHTHIYIFIYLFIYLFTYICIRFCQFSISFVFVSTENWDSQFSHVLGKDRNRDKQANILEQQPGEQVSKSVEKCCCIKICI